MPEHGRSASFREIFATIDAALGSAAAPANKGALKAQIIDLFRGLEREIGELMALKAEVRELVARWKSVADGDETTTTSMLPAPVGGVGVEASPTRADHLNASSHMEKGWSLISLGEYAAAEQALEKALALVPNDTQAAALLGWAQMLQEEYDDALRHFQRVLEREPANALARVNVGYICLKKGIFGEAIEHLSRTIRLDNDRKATLYAHYYLGLLYFERDMHEDAETFLRKAITLGPNLVEAYYDLGRVRWFGGRPDAAREAWREGVAANKFSPWGKRCAEILEQVDAGGAPAR
ncbi:MAG TPA: tetratricopeptide repeat protein [Gemmatimonadaceae bacterium]|nr:tetratricopeptide repeat protein [Gemmatimonadaceae bacterium]